MLQDLLLRGFGRELSKFSHMAKGSGKSGTLTVSRCGQAVLERSALTIDPSTGTIIVRFSAGFLTAGGAGWRTDRGNPEVYRKPGAEEPKER